MTFPTLRLALVCILLTPGLGSASPPIPDTFYRAKASDKFPVFVAADSLFTKDGSYDTALFSPETIKFLFESEQRSADRGCILSSGYVIEHIFDPSNTVRRFLSGKLDHAFSANVIASRFGIAIDEFGRPTYGRIFQLRTLESLLGDLSKVNSYAYIFFPVGTFTAGGKQFCGIDMYGTFSLPPVVGRRVVVRTPVSFEKSANGYVVYGFAIGLISEQPDGSLSYGTAFTPDPEKRPVPTSFDSLLPILRKSVDK